MRGRGERPGEKACRAMNALAFSQSGRRFPAPHLSAGESERASCVKVKCSTCGNALGVGQTLCGTCLTPVTGYDSIASDQTIVPGHPALVANGSIPGAGVWQRPDVSAPV